MRLVSWEEMKQLPAGTNLTVTWFFHENGVRCNNSTRQPWEQTILGHESRLSGNYMLYIPGVTLYKSMYTEGRYWLPYTDDGAGAVDFVPLTNAGKDKCVYCACHTEQRRDFLTFKVREFCPRCKR